MDLMATAVSLMLQHGVPLKLFVDKFTRTRFEPRASPAILTSRGKLDHRLTCSAIESKFLPEQRQGEQLEMELPVAKADGTDGACAAGSPKIRRSSARRAASAPHGAETSTPRRLPRVRHDHGALRRLPSAPNCGSTSGS